jgi:hypothetical protein
LKKVAEFLNDSVNVRVIHYKLRLAWTFGVELSHFFHFPRLFPMVAESCILVKGN